MNLVHGQHPANMRLTSRVAVEPGARECSARLSARTLGLLRLCKLCFLWPIRVVPCGSNRYILGPSMRWAALSHVVNPIISEGSELLERNDKEEIYHNNSHDLHGPSD
ncbi:hypothetical protein EVAR_53760_1 [Eumeta japonica]|uniref:Uncharacterized protein n=1 Tax=Eumeta variegata TaxID=151549 RepID=A0A4C1Z4Q8_EUMVA|nr:hypothetical protein EVAR_53760_1 [Eumeta japonica]